MTDSYWANVDACLDKIQAGGKTVDDVLRILGEHFAPSSSEAFFGGSGGDRSVLGTLMWDRADWSTVWVDADYYWCARDANGDTLSYVEGDVERGNCRRPR